jgi:hypothetical protein
MTTTAIFQMSTNVTLCRRLFSRTLFAVALFSVTNASGRTLIAESHAERKRLGSAAVNPDFAFAAAAENHGMFE